MTRFIKIKTIYYTFILFLSLTNNSIIYAQDNLFYIQTGKLDLEIDLSQNMAWLINRTKSGNYYFQISEGKKIYEPTGISKQGNLVQIELPSNLVKLGPKFKFSNYRLQRDNSLDELSFIYKNNIYKIHPYKDHFLLAFYSINDFNNQYGIPIEKLKSNYTLNPDFIKKELQYLFDKGSWGKEKKISVTQTIQQTIKELLEKKDKDISQDEQIEFTKLNKINLSEDQSPYSVMYTLYNQLIKINEKIRQTHFTDYQKDYGQLLVKIKELREIINDIQKIKNELNSTLNIIQQSDNKIKNLYQLNKEKENIIKGEKNIYAGNLEAHSESGIYVTIFKVKESDGLEKQEPEVDNLIRYKALNDMGAEFIKSQTIISSNVIMNTWIESVKSGIVTLNSSYKDYIPISGSWWLIIKRLKYLPKTGSSSDPITKEKMYDLINKYPYVYFIHDNESRNKAIERIFEQIKERTSISNRTSRQQCVQEAIISSYQTMEEEIRTVKDAQKQLWNDFFNRVSKLEDEIQQNTNQIQDEKNKQTQLNVEITKLKEKSLQHEIKAKQLLQDIDKGQQSLKEKISKNFKVHLIEFKTTFGTSKPIQETLAPVIRDLLEMTHRRLTVVQETITTTIENGFFKEESRNSFEFKKDFRKIEIFSDRMIAQQTQQLYYVVINVEAALEPSEQLEPVSFEKEKQDIQNLMNDIQQMSISNINKKQNEQYQSCPPCDCNAYTITTTDCSKCDHPNMKRPDDIDVELKKQPDLIPQQLQSDNIEQIEDKYFLYKYFDSQDLLDQIAAHTNPSEIALKITDYNKKWRLPTDGEISQLLSNFHQLGNHELKGHRIYIQEANPYGNLLKAAIIDNDYNVTVKEISFGDAAYIIFVSDN